MLQLFAGIVSLNSQSVLTALRCVVAHKTVDAQRADAHLVTGNVDSKISHREDSQQPCVIPAWVVSNLELCFKARALAKPLLDALSLLLWLLKRVLAMKYKGLIISIKPRDEQCHLSEVSSVTMAEHHWHGCKARIV